MHPAPSPSVPCPLTSHTSHSPHPSPVTSAPAPCATWASEIRGDGRQQARGAFGAGGKEGRTGAGGRGRRGAYSGESAGAWEVAFGCLSFPFPFPFPSLFLLLCSTSLAYPGIPNRYSRRNISPLAALSPVTDSTTARLARHWGRWIGAPPSYLRRRAATLAQRPNRSAERGDGFSPGQRRRRLAHGQPQRPVAVSGSAQRRPGINRLAVDLGMFFLGNPLFLHFMIQLQRSSTM
ncbi:hypothetical protein GUJ93_ZPchr0006g43089 [Zizania palustris]|uniref:Uncharacterized protein n=1 Tax=Zizania palustris TaxID=103762 RepID=A0A8J5SM48_ZIZPA|nr:hypothetical protein GUJ93_ZPchr0006g43089 [Zizania palustris]KAG8075932.1 hypothetical protein GUJ93_ZPchr0006g43089 [Zizania palustris]